MNSQLSLPLETRESFTRDGFVVGGANARAVALLDSWPDWTIPAAALHGPTGSGKSHLAAIWRERSRAQLLTVRRLPEIPPVDGPIIIEDVDAALPSEHVELSLMGLIDGADRSRPILLTAKEAPGCWPCVLPDLASRFAALPSIALYMPDDSLLMAIARKLFADRQLVVQEAAIRRMLNLLDRSPASIGSFVAELDRKALAESRPVTSALVGELIASRSGNLS
ncbi:MAG: chromosomal replication initiator DnaA [Rhizomicrobium sp.]|jgi:chromosomal replication initiation ATPase DnaA